MKRMTLCSPRRWNTFSSSHQNHKQQEHLQTAAISNRARKMFTANSAETHQSRNHFLVDPVEERRVVVGRENRVDCGIGRVPQRVVSAQFAHKGQYQKSVKEGVGMQESRGRTHNRRRYRHRFGGARQRRSGWPLLEQ